MRLFSILSLVGLVAAAPADVYGQGPAQSVDRALLDKFLVQSQFAAAAYCNKNNLVFNQKITCPANNCPLVQALDTKPLIGFQKVGSTSSSGFLAVDKTNKVIEISFRGSDSMANFKADAKVSLEYCPEICFQCQVHRGFYSAWKDAAPTIMQILKETSKQYPDYNIITTGHSLGGAIAAIATGYLRTAKYNVTMYSFGAPRTGNFAFAQYIEQSGLNYRVTQTNDPVPRLPPTRFGYTHIYPEYHITTNTVPVPAWAVSIYTSNLYNAKSDLRVVGALNIHVHKIYFGRITACRLGEYGDGWDPEVSALTGQLSDPQDGGGMGLGQTNPYLNGGAQTPSGPLAPTSQLPDGSIVDPNLPSVPGSKPLFGSPNPLILDSGLPPLQGGLNQKPKDNGFFGNLFNPDVYSYADGGPNAPVGLPSVPGQPQQSLPPPNIPYPGQPSQPPYQGSQQPPYQAPQQQQQPPYQAPQQQQQPPYQAPQETSQPPYQAPQQQQSPPTSSSPWLSSSPQQSPNMPMFGMQQEGTQGPGIPFAATDANGKLIPLPALPPGQSYPPAFIKPPRA